MRTRDAAVAAAIILLTVYPGRAETKDEWIALGARIHGAFGPLIPVGIRIGLDAVEKLKPGSQGLTIVYFSGSKAPCPCIADGVMLTTHTSPVRSTLQVSNKRAPIGALATIIIANRMTGKPLRYSIADEWLPQILAWSEDEPPARFDAAMSAEGLFRVDAVK